MSASTLQVWSNFAPDKFDRRVNISNLGNGWVIDIDGDITPPSQCISATPERGDIKVYNEVPFTSVVVHWLFVNHIVGHLVWISRAPAKLSKAQITAIRNLEESIAKDWDHFTRRVSVIDPPPFTSHWDLERYTRPHNLPTVCRGRDQNVALEQTSPETIEHYARLLEKNKYKYTDLGIDLTISREKGTAYYVGNNGLRSYPLDQLGYYNICRALGRVRAYRKHQE